MPKRDPRVTAYIRDCEPFARPLLRRLRTIIHAAGASLDETIKWRMPAFVHQGRILCGFAGFKAHCALWFWDGTAVDGARRGEAMGQFGRLTTLDDLPAPAAVAAAVRTSVARLEAGRRGRLAS